VAALAVCAADAHGDAIARLAGPDALRAVLRASASIADPEARPALFALAGDLARLPKVSLRHGNDPATAVADAGAQLDALARMVADAGPR
jgi:hypothetical protein